MTLSIPHAYRHLYRSALRAVLYSQPARYTVRNRLRTAFRAPRSKQNHPFDPERIHRTLLFFRSAADSAGLERKVVRNLVRVWGEQERMIANQPRSRVLKDNVVFQDKAWEGFDESVRGLERSLGVGFG